MSYDEFSSKKGVGDLPSEILVEIFIHCLPDDRIRLSTPPQLLPPFTLARVCSRWRHLVHSSPKVWSRVILGRHGTDSDKEISVFDYWVQRAGCDTVPLDIVLDPQTDNALQVLLNETANAKYARDTTALIRRFCTSVHRCRSLVLDVLDADVLAPLFSVLSTLDPLRPPTAPLLEELELRSTHLGWSTGALVLHNIAQICPRLRSIILMCPTILPAPAGVRDEPVLWDMRTLKLLFCTAVSHVHDWIDACPNLDELNVRLFSRTDDDDLDIDEFDGFGGDAEGEELITDESDELDGEGWAVVNFRPRHHFSGGRHVNGSMLGRGARALAHLTRLELHSFSNSASVGVLLDSLSTPSLVYLKVSSSAPGTGPRNALWLHVALLLHRSYGPPLEDLEIIGLPMSVDDVRACLRLVPRLKRLSLRMFPELDDLLRELAIVSSSSPTTILEQNSCTILNTLLCPQLEVLNIADTSFSMEILGSMVSARCAADGSGPCESSSPNVTSLKELCVDASVAWDVAKHPVIAKCISKGLKLTELQPDILLNLRVD